MAQARKKPQGMHISREAGNGPILIDARVPDPYEPGKFIPAIKNARSSAVDALYARKRLGAPDDADARLQAAKRFLSIFERAEIGGASAIDYSRAKVDVSFKYSGIAEVTLAAIQDLAAIRAALRRHYRLIELVCGSGMGIEEVATRIQGGPPSGRYRVALSKMLIEGLDMLCDHFGVAVGPNRAPVRIAHDGVEARPRRQGNLSHYQQPKGRKIPIERKHA